MKVEDMIIIIKLNQTHNININQNLQVKIIIDQSLLNIRKMIHQIKGEKAVPGSSDPVVPGGAWWCLAVPDGS